MSLGDPIRKPGVLLFGGGIGLAAGCGAVFIAHSALHYAAVTKMDVLLLWPFVYAFAVGARNLHDRYRCDVFALLRQTLHPAIPNQRSQIQIARREPAANGNRKFERINPRRLQILLTGIFTIATVTYAAYVFVPDYQSFSTEYQPWLYRKDWIGAPGNVWINPPTRWWEIPLAYIGSVGPMKASYVSLFVFVAPWLLAYLITRLVPVAFTKLNRWLRTPDILP